MPWIDSLDWLSLNSLRRYPLREGTSALSTDEYFTIPDTLISDFTLCASSDVTRRFYISKIFNKVTSLIIEISDSLGVQVGSFNIQGAQHTQDKDYYLTPTSLYAGANGKITINTLEDLKTQPAGVFSFVLASTEFEPRVIVPGIQGIDRIKFTDTLNGTYSFTGDIEITSRSNIYFDYDLANNEVLVDAGDDLGLSKQCTFTDCVKSINGVGPDPDTGNINLIGVNCVKISNSAQYTLDVADTCCTPCSGCNDLEELTTRLTSLENSFLQLKDNYNSVNNQLSTYLSTINSNCSCPE
jgi:hypothetical protein